MAKKTKLKISELNSVDMCRRGANQESDIALFKNEEGAPGDATPADAPEGAGTVEVPNTLWKSIVDFARGLMAKTEPNTDESYEEEEEDEEEADVEKSAETFNQRRAQQEIRDDRWKYKDALDMSVESILNDDDLSEEEKVEMIGESIDQFATAYKEMCEKLLKIRVTANKTVVTAKSAEPDEDPQDEGPDHEEEGEEEMKIDKSRFSPEELEQYTALIAKGRVDEDNEEWQEEEEVETKKSMEMHPEVAKALEEMKSIQKSMEMKEMTDIAKKYTLLGKKEEELAKIAAAEAAAETAAD